MGNFIYVYFTKIFKFLIKNYKIEINKEKVGGGRGNEREAKRDRDLLPLVLHNTLFLGPDLRIRSLGVQFCPILGPTDL